MLAGFNEYEKLNGRKKWLNCARSGTLTAGPQISDMRGYVQRLNRGSCVIKFPELFRPNLGNQPVIAHHGRGKSGTQLNNNTGLLCANCDFAVIPDNFLVMRSGIRVYKHGCILVSSL